ncbi:G-type lectin S-receptor-like serine/threonine-protein kinase RLK1 isoform X1 [Populus alba x Populus x berolinensis]|nr:G-type lectin S-receptor-like serine/threonine-protein kinase RLK1 isoform X1 [Populus alba x Populus x berolinensis]
MDTVSKKPVLLARSSYPCNNKTTIFRATLDADGIFRLYSHCLENKTSQSVHIEWSALNNQCNVRGFCDFNSYCSGMGTNFDCSCYPGFAFNDPSEKFSGCYKNVRESFCRGTKEGKMYDVKAVENILFERYPYSVLHVKKENCGLCCLEDCLCEVALYINERCEKYTAPIRYVLKDTNISSIAFFKVKAASSAAPPMSPTIIIESKKSLLVFLAIAFGSVTFLCFVITISTFCVYRDGAYLYEKLSGIISLAGELTLRSFSYTDIYSFGVVLLEIICCRSSIKVDVSTPDEMNLPSWAYQCFAAGQLNKLVKDEHIEFESLERMVKIGLLCVQHDPTSRPCIKNVILMLEGSGDIPAPPAIAPFCSTA